MFSATCPPIFGTDEELSLRNSLKRNFPDSKLLFCTRHLKENTGRALQRDVSEATQSIIINKIFGSDGLTNTNDEVVFDCKITLLEQQLIQLAPNFKTYFTDKLVPKLRNNLLITSRNDDIRLGWTNNNSESANHVIKQMIDWRAKPVTELIDRLYDLVTAQHKDLSRAFIGLGNFKLTSDFVRFRMPAEKWIGQTDEQRKRHLTRFYKSLKPQDQRAIISTDNGLTIQRSTSDGKKPGQRKRPSITMTK